MDAQFKPADCACVACQSMCAHSTCMPTPQEARALIHAGFSGRLARYEPRGTAVHAFVAPAPKGLEGAVLRTTNSGPCTFFGDGKCELHAAGLKPMEGRLAMHDRPWPLVRKQTYRHCVGKRYASVVAGLTKRDPGQIAGPLSAQIKRSSTPTASDTA